MKKMGYQWLSWIQRIIIGGTGFIIFCAGVYHITNQGYGSGPIQLISAILLLLALFLPHSPKWTFNNLSTMQLTLIGLVDFFALVFGIYHLTRPDGLRSGITELTLFALLTLTIFLPSKPPAPRA